MTSLSQRVASLRAALPEHPLSRWASILFSLSVLTYLISLSASEALLLAAAAVYAFHLLRYRTQVNFPPVKLPLALFCLATVLSVFWATDSAIGWFAVRKLVLFLVWVLAVNLIVSASHLRRLYQGLFLESALAGVVAIGQFAMQYAEVRELHPDRIYFYVTLTRIHGFMGHWMNFGGQQMLVFAALAAYLLLANRGVAGYHTRLGKLTPEREEDAALKPAATTQHMSRLWWLALALITLSIILNFTRGVWLGCLVAGVYLVARWKPRWLAVIPLLAILAYLAAPSLVRQRVHLALHPSEDPALSIRLEMWQVGLRMMREHPWLGVGPNNVPEVYTRYVPPAKSPQAGYHEHLHNNFLQLGAERGLPCLAAWEWMMVALGWYAWRIRRKLATERWVADAALAAWLAFLVEGCFEFNFGTSPVLLVFLFVTATPFVAQRAEESVETQKLTVESRMQNPEGASHFAAEG